MFSTILQIFHSIVTRHQGYQILEDRIELPIILPRPPVYFWYTDVTDQPRDPFVRGEISRVSRLLRTDDSVIMCRKDDEDGKKLEGHIDEIYRPRNDDGFVIVVAIFSLPNGITLFKYLRTPEYFIRVPADSFISSEHSLTEDFLTGENQGRF
jgi:hypothetical protein